MLKQMERYAKRNPGKTALGFAVLASAINSPEFYTFADTAPIVDTTLVQVYSPLTNDNMIQWPVVLQPVEAAFGGSGYQDPSDYGVSQSAVASEIRAEAESQTVGTYVCPDGTSGSYIATGKVSAKELQAAYCEEGEGDGGSDDSTPASGDCQDVKGNARILCEAKEWDGVWYRWAGGHQGGAKFLKGCPDPSNAPRNKAHGGPYNGNPSPCGVDCSGLVTMAINRAFGLKLDGWTTKGMNNNPDVWKKIPMEDAKAGDIVTQGLGKNVHHVEIVRKMKGDLAYTFGAHKTGTRTGNAVGRYDEAFRYVGPT
ncbi:MAG TPA: NlpC/P60 family protein [Candidatus Saccharimonadales bacterium]|jgi:cell wall-associated NlpC family hydrolase